MEELIPVWSMTLFTNQTNLLSHRVREQRDGAHKKIRARL